MSGTTGSAQTLDENDAVKVPVSSLSMADSPRRSGENPDHVQVLAGVEAELPPIIVHRPTMKVIDGMHRLRAAQLRDQEEIAVKFFDGDKTEAFVLSVKMNVAHGLPLSLADRKAAAIRILDSRPEWSNRLIASVTGLAARTVAEIRRRDRGDDDAQSGVRIGRDGRLRPVDATERRRLAGEMIKKRPGLSLRQVAAHAGISPETARDVRSRVGRGEQPYAQRPNGGRIDTQARFRDIFSQHLPLLRQLKADPSMRFSETGRILLRLMQAHAMREEEWLRIAENIPTHRRETTANAALHCARLWREFANHIEKASPQARPEPNTA